MGTRSLSYGQTSSLDSGHSGTGSGHSGVGSVHSGASSNIQRPRVLDEIPEEIKVVKMNRKVSNFKIGKLKLKRLKKGRKLRKKVHFLTIKYWKKWRRRAYWRA